MKRLISILALLLAAASWTASDNAFAAGGGGGGHAGAAHSGGGHYGGGHYGGGHYGGYHGGHYHGGWYGGIYLGLPWYGYGAWPGYYWGYPYYPYAPYAAYPAYEPPPTVYVEPAAQSGAISAAPAPAVLWYYCNEPAGYYPYVQQCNSPWVKVVPPPPSNTAQAVK